MMRLIEYARERKLEGYDDVPQDIREMLYAEEQEQSRRKRKRSDSDSTGRPIHIRLTCRRCTGSVSRHVDDLDIPGPREKGLGDYTDELCASVCNDMWKGQFRMISDLALHECLDLQRIYASQDIKLFTSKGVKEGIARIFVEDIKKWACREPQIAITIA
jgi:hypothetical protein